MVHPQKPDFVFRRNGRVHLNWRGRHFSRLLAAEVCALAGYTMFLGSVKSTGYPLHSPVFPFTYPPVRHRATSHFNWTLPYDVVTSLQMPNACGQYNTEISRKCLRCVECVWAFVSLLFTFCFCFVSVLFVFCFCSVSVLFFPV